MGKIWAPADKVLVEIGRFVLVRPIISAVLLLTAILVTLFSQGGHSSDATPHLERVTPFTAKVFNSLRADEQHNTDITNTAKLLPSTAPAPVSEALTTKQFAEITSTALGNNAPASLNQPASLASSTIKPEQKSINTTWQAFRIHKGDTLARLFKKYKVDAKDATTLANLPAANPLKHLSPGKEMLLIIDEQHQLQKLTYGLSDNDNSVVFIRTASGFELEKSKQTLVAEQVAKPAVNDKNIPITTTMAENALATTSPLSYAAGEIHKSLIADARKVGLSTKQASQLAQIFSGQKIQRGDQFSVLFQYSSAKKTNGNEIVIAQLTHADKVLQLIRFDTPKDGINYYTPDGKSLNTSLLRAPIQYTRISSFFSHSRFHPMLHFFRPHQGVDYAAPTGTPIKAAGNGVIAEIERTGGYGKSVLIKHDGTYSTRYAHMSNFASNLHVGSEVQQGQVIGYVGSTGLATGPHLHYEIHVNNVAMNPLTVSLPAQSIPASYRNQFLTQAKILLAQLKSNQTVRLADKGDNTKRS